MMGRHYSLRAAARLVGVDRHTLKAWLIADLAMEFPAIARGSKCLIREQDLETIVRRRAPQSDFARRRRLLQALDLERKKLQRELHTFVSPELRSDD